MQEILNFVRKENREAYGAFIEESKNPFALHYLAEQRAYLFSVLPLKEGETVLLVDGAGGAFTSYLLDANCHVTAWEASSELFELHKLRINGHARADLATVIQYDYRDLLEKHRETVNEEYDYVIAMDVLPYIRKSDANLFIEKLAEYLKHSGKLVLTSENPMGIKYLAGAKNPYTGQLFSGMRIGEDVNSPGEGYSLYDMDKLVEATDMHYSMRYYPFPDAYYPTSIYSDGYLPKQGELHEQVKQEKESRLYLFDEDLAFDKVISQKAFPQYAHSYMWVLQRDGEQGDLEKTLYCKLSNNRSEKYGLYTLICEDLQGRKSVVKRPLGENARAHVENMNQVEISFQKLFEKSPFVTNAHKKEVDGLHFEFVNGTPLSRRLDQYLDNQDYDAFFELLDKYVEAIRNLYHTVGFEPSDAFVEAFGSIEGTKVDCSKLLCGKPVNIDMIPDNIIETENQWCVIDGEWSFSFEIPVNYVVYRVIHYYLLTNSKRADIGESYNLYDRYDISLEEQKMYEQMERHFQSGISAKDSTIFTQKLAATKGVTSLSAIQQAVDGFAISTVYFDRGKGLSESDSKKYELYPTQGVYSLKLSLEKDVRAVRFDIAENSCILRDVKILTEDGKQLKFTHNGVKKKQAILFATDDPQIQLKLPDCKLQQIDIRCEYEPVSKQIIRELIPGWKNRHNS